MAKLDIWDENRAKKELGKRLRWAKDKRKTIEPEWEECETTLDRTKAFDGSSVGDELTTVGSGSPDNSDTDVSINYAFKNQRFIHSQLSANPPTVVARPTSPDIEDRRRADCADRLVRYLIRSYKLPEVFDKCSWYTSRIGTGFIKTIWDKEAGDPLEFDEESGEIFMEGDLRAESPNPWNMFFDPDATTWEDVRYVQERKWIPWEEACYRFPDKKELLEEYRKQQDTTNYQDYSLGGDSNKNKKYDVVEVYEYWEKGLPYNGFLGRFCYHMSDGSLLSAITPNPCRFRASPEDTSKGKAVLPYHIFTDLDQGDLVWGRATVAYETAMQSTHNRLINATMDALHAHGVPRLILTEGSEIADNSITNSPWDIVRITGSQPPHFMSPMPLPPQMDGMMAHFKQGIDDMAGTNEAMFGQQSRETSGFGMQYATNQGNMVRRRLFNKYVLLTESVYKMLLSLIVEEWQETRIVHVIGKEKAFEAVEIKASDISGGYDLIIEYGASLSLDPTARRSEIMTMMPMFEKAGVDARKILKLAKLNELEGAYDKLELASDRQLEIFEEMIESGLFIEPRKVEDHANMLAYASEYVMTVSYKYLTDEQKELIDAHIEKRKSLLAETMAPPPAAASAGPMDGGLPPLQGPGTLSQGVPPTVTPPLNG